MFQWIENLKRNHKTLAVIIDVFDWYPAHLPKEEQRLLRKLDVTILIFTSLSFFCKFLDQTNITNAWVSGLKEELDAHPNALNNFNVSYYTAYVVGQIPMLFIQTRPKIAPYFLPCLEVSWAIVTFAQSKVSQVWHVYLCRALLGFLEAPSFAGTHYILGSWYRKEEIFKRAGVWFMGNSLGSMFSGYLQVAAYKGLDGVSGLSGWRWLFIVDGIITLPLSLIGFVFFPGLPNSPKRWFLSEEEYKLASDRLSKDHVHSRKLSWNIIKRTFSQPMWYICVIVYICLLQSHYGYNYMHLWLKADGYSIPQVNTYPTFVNLLSAISSWLGTTLAVTISIPLLWSFASIGSLFAAIVLTVWTVPAALKFISFYVGGGLCNGMVSPILYSWVNVVLRSDPEQRALVTSSMMTFGYCTYIWVPLFTFPTVEAPEFKHGYPATIAFQAALWILFLYGYYTQRRKVEAYALSDEEDLTSIEEVGKP